MNQQRIQALMILSCVASCAEPRAHGPTCGTVPLTLEMGSPVVTLTLRAKDGTERPTRFLVDTGGGGLMLTEAVARELGLSVRLEETATEEGMRFAPMETPHIEIDGFALDLERARCAAVLDRESIMHGSTPEGFLPGHVLARHHVVFDYPGGRFTMGRPGTMKPLGEPVPSPIGSKSGFPRIEIGVGGTKQGFLLDTGASFTMISITELERWRAADANLPTMTGAVAEANMVGGPMETDALLMRVPELAWGPHSLRGVAAVSRPNGTFEKWMSSMMTDPIVGAIGGNVLRHFRVEIDYASGTTYLQANTADFATVLDGIGLVLGETAEGAHRVDALALVEGKPVCDGVEVGDLLRALDGRSLEGLAHRPVIELLRGKPGTPRTLTLERDGAAIERVVSSVRFLGL
ncbi:MAG: aspartyl protease family protein [Planctomycetota bacterium]